MDLTQDIQWSLGTNSDGHFIEKAQSIPQDYLERLKRMRDGSKDTREKNFQHVASIPICIVEKWLKEGYSVYDEPIRKSIAKLKHENLDYFITTTKEI